MFGMSNAGSTEIHKSLLAQKLFDDFKSRTNQPKGDIAVVELKGIKNHDKFYELLQKLQKKALIGYHTAFEIVVIRLTVKGKARVQKYGSW